jgi:hypothetical protein
MKTVRELREWINAWDQHGHLMPDGFVVGVAGSCIYVHNQDLPIDGAKFETVTDEEDE